MVAARLALLARPLLRPLRLLLLRLLPLRLLRLLLRPLRLLLRLLPPRLLRLLLLPPPKLPSSSSSLLLQSSS